MGCSNVRAARVQHFDGVVAPDRAQTRRASFEEGVERLQKRADDRTLSASLSQEFRRSRSPSSPSKETHASEIEGLSTCSTAASMVSRPPSTPTNKMQTNGSAHEQHVETVIVIDWDDALCPPRMADQEQVLSNNAWAQQTWRDGVKEMSEQVLGLLLEARAYGKVLLVTTRSRQQMESSLKLLGPDAQTIVKKTPVLYAMDLISTAESAKFAHYDLRIEAKLRAVRSVVTDLRARCGVRSCSNLVTIGDCAYEQSAVQEIGRAGRHGAGSSSQCCTKTIRLLDDPGLPGMRLQLSILRRWLSKIVQLESDVDFDFSTVANLVLSENSSTDADASEFGPSARGGRCKTVEAWGR